MAGTHSLPLHIMTFPTTTSLNVNTSVSKVAELFAPLVALIVMAVGVNDAGLGGKVTCHLPVV